MKSTKWKRLFSSGIMEKIWLAVLLLASAYFTSLALDDELWRKPTLHICVFLLAAVFDTVFLRLLHKVLKRKAIPAAKRGVKRFFSSVARGLSRLAGRIAPASRGGKIFLKGEDERSFAWESAQHREAQVRKKLPRLPKNASEREKARHAYTVFVFKRDKNIPAVLTPSEVACRLDAGGENSEIFENYNIARYSEEEKE